MRSTSLLAALAVVTASALPARAAEVVAAAPPPLSFDVAADYLGSAGADGGALSLGLRLQPYRHLAVSLDLGYGLLAASPGVDDRWWLIPSVAWVVPLGRLSLDLGAGVGVGTVSGYGSWSAYVAGPFDPVWHTTAPAARLHALLELPLTRRVALFARAEVAALLPDVAGTLWGGTWLGVQVGLL
ncbi:MAG TPA: hypothetical protein VMB50_09895 [Myxococcales bacterium]|nr:hypothetical protein [Myxococcales bacterium]